MNKADLGGKERSRRERINFLSHHHSQWQGRHVKAAGQNRRVADKPLTVKGLRTADKKSATIIISNADATKIKSASEHLSFLKKCNVMIVVD